MRINRNFGWFVFVCLSVLYLSLVSATSSFALDKFGTISADETWSGDIIVTATVTIPVGVSVTIAPATVIAFADNTSLAVNGELRAVGTAELPITFTSASASPTRGIWGGLDFTDSSLDSSLISHAVIEYAVRGIDFLSAHPSIEHSVFRQNTQGLFLGASSPTVTGCVFDQNGEGTYIYDYSSPVFTDNLFLNNNRCFRHASSRPNDRTSSATDET